MPPSPIPAPLPPWAKFLIQIAPLISIGLQEVLEFIGTMQPSTAGGADVWMHVQASGKPTGSIDARDRFVTTFDIVNITNGAVDNTWTTADFNTVNVQLDALLGDYSAQMQAGYQWDQIRYYRRSFNPLSLPLPFVKSGTPEMTFPVTHAGVSGGHQSAQISITSTEKTAYPKHWGRNYWPAPAAAFATDNRHVSTINVDALCTALQTRYFALMSQEFFPVVPVTQVDKVPTRGLLGIAELQVDDVFDVIRRRRPALTTYRKVLGL